MQTRTHTHTIHTHTYIHTQSTTHPVSSYLPCAQVDLVQIVKGHAKLVGEYEAAVIFALIHILEGLSLACKFLQSVQ